MVIHPQRCLHSRRWKKKENFGITTNEESKTAPKKEFNKNEEFTHYTKENWHSQEMKEKTSQVKHAVMEEIDRIIAEAGLPGRPKSRKGTKDQLCSQTTVGITLQCHVRLTVVRAEVRICCCTELEVSRFPPHLRSYFLAG